MNDNDKKWNNYYLISLGLKLTVRLTYNIEELSVRSGDYDNLSGQMIQC